MNALRSQSGSKATAAAMVALLAYSVSALMRRSPSELWPPVGSSATQLRKSSQDACQMSAHGQVIAMRAGPSGKEQNHTKQKYAPGCA